MMFIRDYLLEQPDLHDGHLLGVDLSADGLELRCRTDTGAMVSLKMAGLVRLRIDNFLEGNVILDVRVFVGSSCPEHLVLHAYGIAELDPRRQEITTRVSEEGWTLLNITSSYGCELVAIARQPLDVRTTDFISSA